jgi:glycosyltransferase involved in cell wall biosynthesis
MTAAVAAAHVVIPAHREEELLGRQLRATQVAVAEAQREWPAVRCTVTVVLDACDDGTDEVVARFSDVTTVSVSDRCVGVARARGIARARRETPSRAEHTWIASTDADSAVPPHWLTTQLSLAARGADLVLGTVVPEMEQLGFDRYRRWWSRHHLSEGHPHVHGANLGFRLSAYDAVGGFRPLPVHEDVDLVHRLQGEGVPVVRTSTHPVLTSARLRGRTPAGFASYLLGL